VPVKSADQQANRMIFKHRELLIGQRTAAINALRGHATEFGIIAAKGVVQVTALLDKLASEEALPTAAKNMFAKWANTSAPWISRLTPLMLSCWRCTKPIP
jgi:transposase